MRRSIWVLQVSSWSFLWCRSCLTSHCRDWPLFDPRAPSATSKGRQIAANRAKSLQTRRRVGIFWIRPDEPTAGISRAIRYDFSGAERGRAHGAPKAWLADLNSEHECRSLTDATAFAERRVLGLRLSGIVGGRRTSLAVAGDWTTTAS